MDETVQLERIPEPPKAPIIGNMLTIDKDRPLQSLMDMTRKLGGIYRLDMMGTPIIMVSDHKLVEELSDESRFDKAVRGALRRVRAIGGDGLFTGDTHAPNWSKAHNILMPTFSRQAMNNYMPMMLDVASQLMLKWERMNDDDEIDVVRDMTAVALDTIGICGFDYRFNSFYRRDYHPFIDALTRTLETCMMQRGLPFESTILRSRLAQMEADVGFMNGLVDELIRERRRGGGENAQNDLMNYMMAGVDKKTGDSLSDENIRYQINTFLIAGHETTSGLMSFTLYFLLNHPDVLARAYDEVDRVLGRDVSVQPTIKQVNQLTYVQQILAEALRLWPTAPALGLSPYEDEVIGGKYKIKKGTFVNVLLLMLHRDKTAWGENAEKFDPENFSREAIAERPVHAYKPFGNGQRACIGRQFALQEATLVIGMILQRFRLVDHTNYELKIKESLSIKPDDFMMKVRLREDVKRSALVPGGAADAEARPESLVEAAARPSHGTSALVLYGSNLGTTEDFARELARASDMAGFDTKLADLDDYAGKLPKEGVVLIASASYNGAPPDNAATFVDWVENAEAGAASDVKYAIFGCGHSDWAATFQATPRIIDENLSRIGATRIGERGEGDARDDIDDEFQTWTKSLWPQVAEALDLDIDLEGVGAGQPLYAVEILEGGQDTPAIQQAGARPAKVLQNRELQDVAAQGEHARSTRHIELELPDGMTYRPGDHLCVVPRNPADLVTRACNRFALEASSMVRLSSTSAEHSQLPVGQPIALGDLFGHHVELQSVATRKDVERLAAYTQCPDSLSKLQALAGDRFREDVFLKRVSVLDLLEEFRACELPVGAFLEMLPALAPRYYSISSSPDADEARCTITVAVVDEPAISGRGRFRGICSNHLAKLAEGQTVPVSIRKTRDTFTYPADDKPLIMIGPGTGIAPFRGFLQARQAAKARGEALPPAMLFFGCRHPDHDFLYREELEAFADQGLCELHAAFSRKDKQKQYVQDLLRKEQDRVWELLEAGGRIFVCGDGSRMEPDVRRTLSLICSEQTDRSAEAADAWMNDMAAQGRYALDVWVGN